MGEGMSDESSPTLPVDAALPASDAPAPSGMIMGLPIAMFVKDGTPSTMETNRIQREEQQAEQRRNEASEEVAEANAGQGRLYRNKLTNNAELDKAYVLLDYFTSRGEKMYVRGEPLQCLADVIIGMDASKPTELTLQLVCPHCKAMGKPQGQCQMQLRQTNRHWELDMSQAGKLILFNDGYGMKPFRSAGVVTSVKFKCGGCNHWTARIDQNRVLPE